MQTSQRGLLTQRLIEMFLAKDAVVGKVNRSTMQILRQNPTANNIAFLARELLNRARSFSGGYGYLTCVDSCYPAINLPLADVIASQVQVINEFLSSLASRVLNLI